MKTLFALAAAGWLAFGLATAGQAQPVGPPPTAVNFTSERGVPFGLVLDGQLLAAPVVRSLHLDYLAPGQHWAEFSVPSAAGLQRTRVNVWLEPGLETSFVLVLRPGRPAQLRQVSRGPITPRDYPAWAPGPDDYGPDQGPYGDNGNGNGGNYGGAYPPAGPGGYPTPGSSSGYPAPGNQPAYPGPGTYSGPGNAPNYPGPAGPGYGAPAPGPQYARPLSPRDAADLAQALSRCPFDEQRLDIAHQALERSSLRSVELAALVRTLTFDKSQKELAKFGYAHVVDPQNFYRVYDAFTFPTSAREVQQALGLPRN
ncbi:DUF4476 domain-containing protein [Hymenobacter sp. PAMC 26628]|uniref:DUF4476 domain-containing protein n=1 Tax=Hymenobacter sp. PAMC 26628 TaxID=1484118 RepID=UPI0007705180|nr:DUF4476 domain-containing protein [Hymenobacter sp. PAMC 26628]AMJ67417.1 hypothetical protein AXW84_19805 [Hymenobacter sp. PAMC 26628]